MGFYHFVYSLPVFFFVIGYGIKHQDRFSIRNLITMTVFIVLTYFCHLLSALAAFTLIAFLVVWLTTLDVIRRMHGTPFDETCPGRAMVLRVGATLGAFLPTLALAAHSHRAEGSPTARQSMGRAAVHRWRLRLRVLDCS
jgi:hypothetical protein